VNENHGTNPATIERARSIIEDLLELLAAARAWRRVCGPEATRHAYLAAHSRLVAAIDALEVGRG
jgi:hypothetical protein